MKTKVLITIDTEFSIGGAFADPVKCTPIGPQAVLCEVGGRSHGLGFLLGTFARYGTRATFMVEAFNTYFFGDAPMRELALRIKAAGQDVQLHLHPCWTYFKRADWAKHLQSDPPSDHMHSRSVDQLTEWLADGVAIFERWGMGRPQVLRTGSMMADLSVYRAMERTGIRMASNIAFAVYQPPNPELHLYSGVHQIGGVTEAPVLTYIDFMLGTRAHYKSLTITGSSWDEMQTLLQRAHEADIETVVILTHPFEYVKYENPGFTNMAPNPLNQQRLVRLCEFIAQHGDRFESATLGELALGAPRRASSANTVLKVPALRAVGRIVQNKLNEMRA